MNIYFKVIRLELKLFFKDRAMLAAVLAFVLCAAAAIASGIHYNRNLNETLDRSQARENKVVAEQLRILDQRERDQQAPPDAFYDPSNPAAVGVFSGRYATLPVSPWAPLAIGQNDLRPSQVIVTTQSNQALTDTTDTENPLLLSQGRLDLAFVFVVLFPLVLLASSYDLVSRERERGRLALMFGQSASAKMTFGVRLFARGLPVLGLGVVTSIVCFLSTNTLFSEDGLIRCILWSLFVVAYGAFWLAAAGFVNMLGQSSHTNALILLAGWLMFVVVMPSFHDAIISYRHPIPSRIAYSVAARQALSSAQSKADDTLTDFLHDHPELAAKSDDPGLNFLPKYLAVSERAGDAVAPLLQDFQRSKRAQQEASAELRFLSPAVVAHWAFCDLAGTGPQRWSRFEEALFGFQEEWRDFFLPRSFGKQRLTAQDFRNIPSFQFAEEEPHLVARRGLANIASLLLATLILLTLSTRFALPRVR